MGTGTALPFFRARHPERSPPITLFEQVRPACARWQQAGRGGPVQGRHTGL